MSKPDNEKIFKGVTRAYFTTDKKGNEQVHSAKPSKVGGLWIGIGSFIDLAPGSIQKLKGSSHTFEDGVYIEEWEIPSNC